MTDALTARVRAIACLILAGLSLTACATMVRDPVTEDYYTWKLQRDGRDL